MAELAAADVERYTGGRLDKDDPETVALLARGLAIARRFCGWHVTPALTTPDPGIKLDGPGHPVLVLPTRKLTALTALTENSVALDVATDVYWSERGLVRKKSGAWWSCNYGSITVKMTHGFDTAPDFDAAVLSLIDRMSLEPVGGRARVIGPFQYEIQGIPVDSALIGSEHALLEQYRLDPWP